MCSNHHSRHSGVTSGDRYRVEPDGGSWTVMDTLTGLPAATNGKDLVQLRKRDADEIAEELNGCERRGTASPLL
jgi:hypothetical protein